MSEPIRDPEGLEIGHLHEVAALQGARVLEVGCGDGRLTWRYAALASRVVGIDPDIERLATAVQRRPHSLERKVTFLQALSETLPFDNGQFDVALLAWSL